jgi:hypothetical protein
MAEFEVKWVASVDLPDEREAARFAWDMMRVDDSTACIFDVADSTGMTSRIDLHNPMDSGLKVWVPSNSQIAELAQYMHDEGWGVGEIIEMIRSPWRYAAEYSKMIVDAAYDEVAKEPEELDDSTDNDTDETTKES